MRIHNLIKYMSQVSDFRDGFNLKPNLVDILTIAVLAVLSGGETWDDMELYGKERHSLLKKFLELPAGIPSHDIFNRVFALLNPKSLETALQEWISSLVATLPPVLISIDGKSLRESNKPSAHSFVHMVSAFACSCGLSLAQNADHGRVEKRRTRIYRDMACISQFWAGLSAVIRVDSLRYDKTNAEYKA